MHERLIIPSRMEYQTLRCKVELPIYFIDSNKRLLLGIQRAFERIGRAIPKGGTLVSLGCKEEPYLESFKIFEPSRVIGVDREESELAEARKQWKGHEDCLGFTPEFPAATDATNPEGILSSSEQIDIVMLLQPSIEVHYSHAKNQMYRTMVKNWLTRLDDNGYLIITTYDPKEAEMFLRDEEIRKRVVAYGLTDEVEQFANNPNTYIVVLQKNVTTEKPARLLQVNNHIENGLLKVQDDIQSSKLHYKEAVATLREEAKSTLHHYRPDLKMPTASRRKTM